MEAKEILLDNLAPSRNVRDGIDIEELTESIREHGVLQPIRVRPVGSGRYQIIAGHRRVAASRAAGHRTVPAIVADESDEMAAAQTIVENLQREDLTPLELSRGIRELQTVHRLPIDDIGRAISKSPGQVRAYIKLSHLPDDVVGLLEGGEGRTHAVRGLARRHVRELTRDVPIQPDSPGFDDRVHEAAEHIRSLDYELQRRGERINAHQADEVGRAVKSGRLSIGEAVDHVLENADQFRYRSIPSSSAELEAETAAAYHTLQRELATTISRLRPEIASAFTPPQKQTLLEMLDPSIERLLRYQAILQGEASQRETVQPELLSAPE